MPATIRLRPTSDADLTFVTLTEGSPENRVLVTVWSHAEHAASLRDEDVAHFVVECATSGLAVGYVIVAGRRNPHGTIELKRIAMQDKGQGYGRATLKAVKAFAFDTLAAHRLWLDVVEHNHRARALYASEGFREEGLLRECYKGPAGYESMYIMGILEDEYRRS